MLRLLQPLLLAGLFQDFYTSTGVLGGVDAFHTALPSTKRRIKDAHSLQSQPVHNTATTRLLPTCLGASVSDAAETESSVPASTPVPTEPASFISPMYQCYIEDTDSYGVMYNANYLRCFDRALHSFYAMGDDVISANRNNDDDAAAAATNREQPRQSILDTHEDWAIVQVDNQKFKTSPKLGGGYCVHGTLVEHQDDLEVWDLVMQETGDPQSATFNSARVTIARPGVFATPSKIVADVASDGTTTTKDIFRLFRDEFDSHYSTHIPLRNVLTLFERSRSNFLGGPDSLRKLKEEHGLLFVVTKVNNCCKFPIVDEDDELKPGQLVLVETTFQVNRKGMIIACQQTLKTNNRPVAQATVSLMTLDAETFKPSTNLPDWLKELLEGQ